MYTLDISTGQVIFGSPILGSRLSRALGGRTIGLRWPWVDQHAACMVQGHVNATSPIDPPPGRSNVRAGICYVVLQLKQKISHGLKSDVYSSLRKRL